MELFPAETVPFATPIEPLEQEILCFLCESLDPRQVVRDAVIGVVASQLGFGCLPQFRSSGFWRS
jgi:hypothetical protein